MPSVLDTLPARAYILMESGGERVMEVLQGSDHVISAVNLSELVNEFLDHGLPAPVIPVLLKDLKLVVLHHDSALAEETGRLGLATHQLDPSLGDRACIALAQRLDATALTADHAWTMLKLGMRIECLG